MPTHVDASTSSPSGEVAGQARRAPDDNSARNTRARIDESVQTPGETLAPLQAALKHVESHTASLHDGLSDLLLDQGKKILTHQHKIFSKTFTLSRLENDEDRIPQSARVSFKLNTKKEVEEMPAFTTLQTKSDTLVREYNLKLKGLVLECGKLETIAHTATLRQMYAQAIFQIVSIYHVAQGVHSSRTNPTAIWILENHGDTVLKHLITEAYSVADFIVTYKEVNKVAADEILTNTNDRAIEIKRSLESILVAPWGHYLNRHKEKQLVLSLKKYSRETLTSSKTSDAVDSIEQELPADRQQLQELIRKEAQALVNAFKQRLPKNQSRGPKKSGASQTNRKTEGNDKGKGKGKGTSKSTVKKTSKSPAAKADGSNSATTQKRRGGTKKQSKTRSRSKPRGGKQKN